MPSHAASRLFSYTSSADRARQRPRCSNATFPPLPPILSFILPSLLWSQIIFTAITNVTMVQRALVSQPAVRFPPLCLLVRAFGTMGWESAGEADGERRRERKKEKPSLRRSLCVIHSLLLGEGKMLYAPFLDKAARPQSSVSGDTFLDKKQFS